MHTIKHIPYAQPGTKQSQKHIKHIPRADLSNNPDFFSKEHKLRYQFVVWWNPQTADLSKAQTSRHKMQTSYIKLKSINTSHGSRSSASHGLLG
jgi:hypothetical protein